jgi:predicted CXXCH cytochrome family protein
MRKLKFSFAFVLMMFLVGMFSAVAFASTSNPPDPVNGSTNDATTMKSGIVTNDSANDNKFDGGTTASNANQTGSGVGTNDGSTFNKVIKSSNLKQTDGAHAQRTHGSYMNNTNSCASCHQTHTAAASSLLFKDGKYDTCTACHDGTLGFYNVFSTDTSKTDGSGFDNSAGTFGGSHDANMSAHMATGALDMVAAPGGDRNNTTGSWEEEFTCASCHAPHGSFSDRLLNENPNDMAVTTIQNGGQYVQNVPVVDATTVTSFNTKYAPADQTYTDAAGSHTINYIVYRFKISDPSAPTNTMKETSYDSGQGKTVVATVDQYAKSGLASGDTVLQLMSWNGTKYVVDQDPWYHEYDFDTAHKKHEKTAFYDGVTNYAAGYADPAWASKPQEMFDTDQLQKGAVYGYGFAGIRVSDAIDFPGAAAYVASNINTLTSGKISRAYFVKLDVTPSVTSDLANKNVVTTNVASLWDSSNPGNVSGRGVLMSSWCAACHTDYLANSGDGTAKLGNGTGHFDTAYRHTTTSDTYTCIRCHFSHGTDSTVMRDARGLTYTQILNADPTVHGDNYFPGVTGADRVTAVNNYMLDQNPSSALKRYTNMAVCWGCHTSSHSGGTRNTDSYQYNTAPGVDTDRNGIANTTDAGTGTVNAGY